MDKLNTITLDNFISKLKSEGFADFIQQLLNQYENLGPLPGILLPFIEAFLPFLPLVIFVLGNAAAYGLFEGFLYSWIGASAGGILLFYIVRWMGDLDWIHNVRKNKQVSRVTGWVERRGFGPLFLLLCFPFAPSSVINIVAGLSKISAYQYILAVLLGKSVMIFSIAYVGSSVMEFAQKPIQTIIILLAITLFWFLGKYIENRLKKKGIEKKPLDMEEQ